MENNFKRGAGLRRSALAERIQIREEWSALKETDKENIYIENTKSSKRKHKKPTNINNDSKKVKTRLKFGEGVQKMDILKGTVALVSVGDETASLALRSTLRAMGASVLQDWSPIVTHLVWTEGGCRAVRARARALAARLVSPQWVEACAALGVRAPERQFPCAPRASDLPSPATLRRMLKKAEMENLPLANLLSDSEDAANPKALRLRMSSESESDESLSVQPEKTKINAQPRRPLYTHKEPDTKQKSSEEETEKSPVRPRLQRDRSQATPKQRRDLASAARLARRQAVTPVEHSNDSVGPNIVLTGMSRLEKRDLCQLIRNLSGHVHKRVTVKTTHVLMKVGLDPNGEVGTRPLSVMRSGSHPEKGGLPGPVLPRTLNSLLGAARGCKVLSAQWLLDSSEAGEWLHHGGYEVPHLDKICKKAQYERAVLSRCVRNYAFNVFYGLRVSVGGDVDQRSEAVQLLRLCGARVLEESDDGVDLKVGTQKGQVAVRWVFDSVVEARTKATRRYVT